MSIVVIPHTETQIFNFRKIFSFSYRLVFKCQILLFVCLLHSWCTSHAFCMQIMCLLDIPFYSYAQYMHVFELCSKLHNKPSYVVWFLSILYIPANYTVCLVLKFLLLGWFPSSSCVWGATEWGSSVCVCGGASGSCCAGSGGSPDCPGCQPHLPQMSPQETDEESSAG